MPRHLKLEPHLSLAELENRYRQAKEGIEKTHYQTVWLLAQGKATVKVAEVTGYSLSWIYELVRSYNYYGPSILGDQRRNNHGSPPLLNDEQQALLWQALQELPEDGGLWTGPKVARWMSQLLERKVSPQRGWEYLKGWEFRLRRPRPHHEKASEEEQEAWKKKLADETARVQGEFPDAQVEVWAEVETDLFNRVLADFAKHYGIGPQKQVILAIDRAGWHISQELIIPEGIHLVFMPPHSPELQPAERLWTLTNEPVANRTFKTLKELEELIYSRCQTLLTQKELIRGLTNFYWWPQTSA